ncbi:MAG: haloacid dehalogenase-like hydrolase [Bacteroides sp.]|nr:haloacid dehalogenase-like hydrolase [Prevotella sp.]MCM1407198.1 haloacid dehalogenase-like hydrolase [Treponema brennaborense]MCM1470350.1 haloacid dehalogenase-like hydrolase [Bacteroides sp.]
MAPKKTPVALIYDFDGTLSPGNMQEFSFLKALGIPPEEFWQKTNELSEKNDANSVLCYMKLMLDEARAKRISLKRESFTRFGKEIELFKGVKEWFGLINNYGRQKNLDIKHYINSSGLKEMIEGTAIASEFARIYACSFLYNVDGVAEWPAVAVDFTTKTQFLFKINKGIDSVSDNKRINEYVPEDERPVPFAQMIYFGDGTTDIPCMKMVRQNGGHSVAVYKPKDAALRRAAEKLILENRVNFVCPADYTKDKEIYTVVTTILDKIKSDYDFKQLKNGHYRAAEKSEKQNSRAPIV